VLFQFRDVHSGPSSSSFSGFGSQIFFFFHFRFAPVPVGLDSSLIGDRGVESLALGLCQVEGDVPHFSPYFLPLPEAAHIPYDVRDLLLMFFCPSVRPLYTFYLSFSNSTFQSTVKAPPFSLLSFDPPGAEGVHSQFVSLVQVPQIRGLRIARSPQPRNPF